MKREGKTESRTVCACIQLVPRMGIFGTKIFYKYCIFIRREEKGEGEYTEEQFEEVQLHSLHANDVRQFPQTN